jgi:hypothetical protein
MLAQPQHWRPLLVIGGAGVLAATLAIAVRWAGGLALAAALVAAEELISLELGGVSLRTGALAIAMLLVVALELGFWARDAQDVVVERPVRGQAIVRVTAIGGAAATCVTVAALPSQTPSLLLSAVGAAAILAAAAAISLFAIIGTRSE